MILRKLGFYRELDFGDPEGLSITERRPLAPDAKECVLRYLESAPVVAASQMVAKDYFTGVGISSRRFLTDGTWVWFSDLPHYVRTYGTVLDPDFIDTAMEKRVVSLSEVDINQVIEALPQLS